MEERDLSLLDLLPTFEDIASNGNPPEMVDPVDGHSMVGLMHNNDSDWQDEVMMEYTCEGVYLPCFILRKDCFKYIFCEDDPGMLFDLNNDPKELRTLCGVAEYADIEAEMTDTIHERWNSEIIKEDIIKSQTRRRYVQSVLLKGNRTPWDYQTYRDASCEFVRSSVNTNTTMTKGLARFPYMKPADPDHPRSE